MTVRYNDAVPRGREVMDLTSRMMHLYYCEGDMEGVIAHFDEGFLWLGAGEQECAAGTDTVKGIFRQFAGQVPKCIIHDEEYHVLQIGPETYLCMGRMWIETAPETEIYLRFHQRITTAFRETAGELRCCHIHISNPYGEMMDDDVGFPTHMARQSHAYVKEQLEVQRQKQADLTYRDFLTGVYNQNRFNEIRDSDFTDGGNGMGVACLDLNGLKELNDRMGHSAGDDLICRTAAQLRRSFPDQVYRTGGDEFVVVDCVHSEVVFHAAMEEVRRNLIRAGISCSIGASWRPHPGNIRQQYDEADQRMYQDKRKYYSSREHDRRNRR